jgi:RNA polymerase sigma-70 factor, ECF subfamily
MGNEKHQSSWEDIYWAHREGIVRFCTNYCTGLAEAEDITQEVFIRLRGMLDKIDYSKSQKPLLYEIARNLCLNKIRDEARHKKIEKFCWTKSYFATTTKINISDNRFNPEKIFEANDEKLYLNELLSNLSVEQREALLLQYFEKLNRQEICEIMDLSLPQIKRLLLSALKKLRNIHENQN